MSPVCLRESGKRPPDPDRRYRIFGLLLGVAALWGTMLVILGTYLIIPGSPIGRVNDFLLEAETALRQLYGGHFASFLTSSPEYAGSLLSRAPFAFAAMADHASWQVVYVATALPCLVAAPLLALWLQRRSGPLAMSTRGAHLAMMFSPLGILLAINPVLLECLKLGHPEDVVGACLAIAGVVQAARQRPSWALLLLALAAANKSWAWVAVPVGFAALDRITLRAGVLFALVTVSSNLPIVLAHGGGAGALGASTGNIFFPLQFWWWFGSGEWFAVHAHELIVLTAFGLSASWWLRRRRLGLQGREIVHEALLLLSLALLWRAAMDPWNNPYYELPFLMAVYAVDGGRLTRRGLVVTLLVVLSTYPFRSVTPDTRAVVYQLLTAPMIGVLMCRVLLTPQAWQGLVQALTAERRLVRHREPMNAGVA